MLPDEIISEILSPALKVSDELFSDTSDVSPFAKYTLSTSAYLLVCKDWLRVATPLLYNVVVLRSKSQANALEKVLLQNQEFGRFIKKLRVEGGFGIALHTILKSAPNITDVSLSLAIWSSDSTSGLCKGLSLINPQRVILLDPYARKPLKNQQLATLSKTVRSCIRTWDNMKIFGFPYGSKTMYDPIWTQRALNLVEALSQSHVQTVLLSSTFNGIPSFIEPLCKIGSLKVLQFHSVDPYTMSRLNSDPQIKALARYPTSEPTREQTLPPFVVPDIAPSLNPTFKPMQFASEEVQETIWKRVLFFAMYVEEFRSPSFSPLPTESHPSRLPILRVSRYFNRLGLPYLYDCPNLTYVSMRSIQTQLEAHPDLGAYIRFLFVPDSIPDVNMLEIVALAPNLERLLPRVAHRPQYIFIDVLNLLARTAGSSLQEISGGINPRSAIVSPSILAQFTALRVLDLRSNHPLKVEPDSKSYSLKMLHTLRIDGYDTSFFEVFAGMRLESLHTVSLSFYMDTVQITVVRKFLRAHGDRILHLTVGEVDAAVDFSPFDLCKNLVEVEFHGECNAGQLTRKTAYKSLTKIVANELSKSLAKLDSLNFDKFPALREIRIRRLEWPVTERGISKSKVIPFAESLLENDIKLTDSTGKHWVPRVQSTRARKG
ncbi:hypothetical protein B0H11DRAFT_582819 [Mycena galericulata]|nr:hypothetical protein B0H11DRAFT_582819 [Mycena galericulata]